MEKIVIRGGTRLHGDVTISGAKNAAVAIIPAVVLAEEPCVIENVPAIRDVTICMQILRDMGASVRYLNASTVEIDARHLIAPKVDYELARKMRASYYFVGALLGRCGMADVPLPGGCDLGVRPIDRHIKGFEALGAKLSVAHGTIHAEADKLVGTQIYFDDVSVGATINVMLAAVKAEGLTVLENAAKEPQVVDLANFLNSLGADVRGAGTDVIKIRGVEHLGGASYSIIPDQIEAGTFMIAAAATMGDVTIRNVIPKHLEAITYKLLKSGAEVTEYDDALRVTRTGPVLRGNVKTAVHPGFPTDMQPQMTVLLSIADGTSIVTDGIFDNRFRYVEELRRMGANISVDSKVAVVEGVPALTAAPVKATDLRAGAALIIAGLIARGETEIEEIQHIERGYENIVGKLTGIGADIRKIEVPEIKLPKAL